MMMEQTQTATRLEAAKEPPTKKRRYTGPTKGSEEAKKQMEKVRAAQWAKHGLKM